jgi:hypothetical protein
MFLPIFIKKILLRLVLFEMDKPKKPLLSKLEENATKYGEIFIIDGRVLYGKL